jgi:hypothetical protein
MEPQTDARRSHLVAVFAAPDDRHTLSEILAEVLRMHPTDALIHARMVPGFVGSQLTAETAERLAGAIRAIGLNAEAVDSDALPNLEQVDGVHHVRCVEAGLEILELHGSLKQLIAWSEIELIGVGDVPQETSRHYPVSGMSVLTAARRSQPDARDMPLSPGPELWILCRNPDRGFRIDHKRMNYEYLGARKSDSATANFRLFLDDVIARIVPHAYLTPATRAYVEHGSANAYAFHDTIVGKLDKWMGNVDNPNNAILNDEFWADKFESVTRRFKEWVLT